MRLLLLGIVGGIVLVGCGDGGVVGGDDAGPAADAGPAIDSGPPIDTGPRVDAGPPPTVRALFVGNSYTFFNELPTVVREIGAASGVNVEVEMIAPGGARLADHWMTSGARARIEEGGLDVVVVQGQSLEPLLDGKAFYGYGMLLAQAIRDAGADGVWYATWARRAGSPDYAMFGLGDPESMTRRLEYAYTFVADVDDDVLARVGAAWQIALAEMPGIALHTDDTSHPTPAGSLLASCVIFQALADRDPVLPTPAPLGIDQATAEALCAIAPRVRCLEGSAYCDGACADTQYNARHCGACAVSCAGEDPCRMGVCGCEAGLTGCDELCVDLASDPTRCGDCDTACSTGQVCNAGECACPRAAPLDVMPADLTALRPACTSWYDGGSIDCNAAGHAYCEALDCFDSGVGPPAGHSPRMDQVMCVRGDVRTTTYATLSALVPACDGVTERNSQACSTAIHRWCVANGAATGFGPTEAIGDDVRVTCLPAATIRTATREELYPFASRCTADPVQCGIVAWGYCASLGHAGGFGPIEVTDTTASIACLDH